MLLVKLPAPVPFSVLVVNAIVGLTVVLQHIPLAVIIAPPSEVIFPPAVAVEIVRFDGVVVVRIDAVGITVVSLTQRTENPQLLLS